MKINLHCHTNYSDGDDIFDMAQEHKSQGFSAFVATDHVYPFFVITDKNSADARSITSYDKFRRQSKELEKISIQLDFPCIQGMELALYGEEILVFGKQVSKDIFDFLENINAQEYKLHSNTICYKQEFIKQLYTVLQKNKKDSAIILCHPNLISNIDWVLMPLYPLLDGYEFQNSGYYYFKDETNINERCWDRPVPPELLNKNKFYNSDAHSVKFISRGKSNFHTSSIANLEDLIKHIKTPQKQR